MSSGSRIATAAAEALPVTAWLGLGGNVGDRAAHLAAALRMIGRVADVLALSPVYATDPVGHSDQPEFWNMVARIRTDLAPAPLLAELQRIEREVGRTATFRNGPREIDIDLLLYGDVVSAGDPEIPHPRMHERAFVLRPLLDLDADLQDPRTGERLERALAGVGAQRVTRVLDGGALLEDE